MGFPVAGWDRLWLALVRTLQAPDLIVSLWGDDDQIRGSRGGLEQPGHQPSSSSCGVRAAASLIAASQRGRWYRTGELLVGNLRRQCTPALKRPALRHRQSVLSLTPNTMLRERASTQSPAVGAAIPPRAWLDCFIGQLLSVGVVAVSMFWRSLPVSFPD